MPTVSVIITAYNRAHIVERAIFSALAQTYQDFEIVLIDDASHDDLAGLFERKHWPKVRYVRNAQNRGIAGAKNAGIAAAQGRFIAFLDSDDEWYPDKLARQLEALASRTDGAPLCFTGYHVLRDNGLKVTRVPHKYDSWLRSSILGEMFGLGSTLFADRACFEQVGLLDESIGRMEDRDWIMRYFDHWPDLAVVEEPLALVHNSGWPSSDVVRTYMAKIVDLNVPRIAKHGEDLTRMFMAGTEFEIASVEYRNREYFRSCLRLARVLVSTPSYATYLMARGRRKFDEADFR